MDLNQTTLRGILAQVLSVDQAYVVPKQGNWWNPQEQAESPDTWCAYVIRSNVPRTAPYFSSSGDTNRVCVNKIADIDLQFVGPQAEDMAQGVAIWHLRNDVARAFATVQGSIMYTDSEARSNVFYQDGANTVLAWNAKIKVNWIQVMNTTQQIVQEVNIDGIVSNRDGDMPEGADPIVKAYINEGRLYLNLESGSTMDMGPVPLDYEIMKKPAPDEGYTDSYVLMLAGTQQGATINVRNDKTYTYTTNGNEAEEWIIDHNLDKYPAVSVADDNGNMLFGDVQYITKNRVKILFSAATSGKAYLN